MTDTAAKPRFLMCPPEHFGVNYAINPWMDPPRWAPLSGGEVMVVPGAFTADGMRAIRERVPSAQHIEVGHDDACRLAANAVCLGNTIVMAGATRRLRDRLTERGYRVAITPLPSFRRSGGSAFCLTLRLDRRSRARVAVASAAVA